MTFYQLLKLLIVLLKLQKVYININFFLIKLFTIYVNNISTICIVYYILFDLVSMDINPIYICMSYMFYLFH